MRTTRVSVFFFSMIKEPFLWERQRQRAKSYSIWIAALHFSFSPHYHHLEIQKCADKSPYAHRCPILAQLHSPRCLLHQHILCFPIYIDIEPDKTTSLSSKKLCSLSFPFIRSISIHGSLCRSQNHAIADKPGPRWRRCQDRSQSKFIQPPRVCGRRRCTQFQFHGLAVRRSAIVRHCPKGGARGVQHREGPSSL